jgi:hypothetical protein
MNNDKEYYYEITDDLVIYCYWTGNDVPYLEQPFHPSTQELWKSKEEAESWVIQHFEDYENSKNNPKVIPFVENPLSLPSNYDEIMEQAKDDSERLKRIEKMLEKILNN